MGAFKPQTTIEELMETGIISVHLYNCLKTAGFEDFNSIFEFRKQQGLLSFLNLKNFGRKALTELEVLFSGCYIPNMHLQPSEAGMAEVFEPFYKSNARESDLFKRAYPSLEAFCQSINATTEMPSYKEERLEVNDVTALWHTVAEIISKALDSPIASRLTDGQRRHLMRLSRMFTLQIDRNRFVLIYEQRHNNPLLQELLRNEYERMRQSASARTRNLLQARLPKYEDALGQYFRGGLATRLLPSCGKKSVAEINTLLRQYFDFAYDLIQKDLNEIEHTLIVGTYHFLTAEDVEFVQQFKSKYWHLPMLFILYRHMLTTDNRYETFYRMAHGIGCNRMTQAEIASASGLSFERVRQILSTGSICPSITVASEWKKYNRLFDQLCFSSKSADFEALRKAERLGDMPFSTFGSLCSAIGGYKGIEIGGGCVYVKTDIARQSRIKAALRLVYQTSQRRTTTTTTVGISDFFDEATIAPLNAGTRKLAFQTLAMAAALLWGIASDSKGRLIFKQNTMNIESELYDIISEQGHPVHISVIFNCFKDRHPDHRFTKPSQIRAYLLSSSRIKPIGKSSKFTIDKWVGVYTGTIRQMIHDIINESAAPVNCHDILDRVRECFPQTNYNSVSTMVMSDSRYCRFNKSTVGIKGRDYGDSIKPVAQSQWIRLPFEERIHWLETFLTEHHHIPSSSGDAEEQALMRWCNNIKAGRLKLSDGEKELFDSTMHRLRHLTRTKSELTFSKRCDELKDFIKANNRYPTRVESPRLYNWLADLRRGHDFTGHKAEIFADLQQFIASHQLRPL